MNNYQELFITKYVKIIKQDRLKYEIDSKKKKNNFLNHFCHDTFKYVDEKKIIYNGKYSEIVDIFEQFNKEIFYVISTDFDGKMMNMNDLKQYLSNEYMPVIAISYNVVIIKEEMESYSNLYIMK